MTIKGTKSGIILVLNKSTPFDQLEGEIASKFQEASSFFGDRNMGLMIRGRALSSRESDKVIDIIQSNSSLKITCIIEEDSAYEQIFVRGLEQAKENTESADASLIESDIPDLNDAEIFYGNLRSGQDISSKKSIILLGDVKPGATVTSFGSIFVLGELRGNAFAGAAGEKRAVVMAMDLNPLQIRIADAIAISPDAEKGPKLKPRKKKLLGITEKEPEVAYIDGDKIYKTGYGASFIRDHFKD